MFDEAIEPEVFAHVFEEVFLIPSGEHGGGGACQVTAVIGAQDRGLVAGFAQGSDFTNPEAVGQPGAAFGELECAFFSVGMGKCLCFF